MKNGQADILSRNGLKKPKIIKLFIVFFLIIFLFISILIGIYNFRNYKLYKYIITITVHKKQK